MRRRPHPLHQWDFGQVEDSPSNGYLWAKDEGYNLVLLGLRPCNRAQPIFRCFRCVLGGFLGCFGVPQGSGRNHPVLLLFIPHEPPMEPWILFSLRLSSLLLFAIGTSVKSTFCTTHLQNPNNKAFLYIRNILIASIILACSSVACRD